MLINNIRNIVFSKKPALKKLIADHGEMSLFEYWKTYFRGQKNPPNNRKQEFLNFITTYTSTHFWDIVAKQVCTALETEYCVSTADHHGPIGHAFFFQSAILRGLTQPHIPIIQFCTSHVSLGNSSYPRGLLLHKSNHKQNSDYIRLPLFWAKDRMLPVYNLSSYTRNHITQYTLPALHNALKNNSIYSSKSDILYTVIRKILENDTVLNEKTYSKQITQINSMLWEEIFKWKLPALICLDAEDIVRELLLMLIHQESLLSKMIFDKKTSLRVEEYFDWIACCFTRKKDIGTYLFWYLDEKNNRHALWREWDELIIKNRSLRIKMDTWTLAYYLSSGKLIPSGLLIYTMLDCYYGITCFGGFSQWTYLPQMQDAYIKLELDSENSKCIKNAHYPLCEDMIFLFGDNGEIKTALDILINGGDLSNEQLSFYAKKQTLAGSIDVMMPEIARCL